MQTTKAELMETMKAAGFFRVDFPEGHCAWALTYKDACKLGDDHDGMCIIDCPPEAITIIDA